ncbi:MAG: 1-acyl-sn-glycerol-3-phosphate acyltransferase [Pirellulales bacterium]|nr:1-acyl-sn-glycerol-3-phosphate acyltransferase [Pirellulales bacterium]
MSNYSLLNRLQYQFFKYLIRCFAAPYFRIRYSGLENIPAEGGVLAVSNHQSHLDPPLVGAGCPRRMNYLARETLFRFAPFGRLIYAVGAIPLDREGVGLSGIKESLRRLKKGEMLLVFPEGTRSPDGEMHAFKPGFTALAVRSKSAILPIAIEGAYRAWPKQAKFPRPRMVNVHYGPPILPNEYENIDERELVKLIENRVRQCQAELRKRPVFAKMAK